MRMLYFASAAAVAIACLRSPRVHGDFLEYGTASGFIPIEGKIANRNRNNVSIDVEKYGRLVFNRAGVKRILLTDDLKKKTRERLGAAYKSQNVEDLLKGSLVLLKHGWTDDYYATIQKIQELKPDHEIASKVLKLRTQMAEAVPAGNGEKEMREKVARTDMKAAESKHFIVLHDLGKEKRPADAKLLIDERLDLLEKVYESFLLFFYARNGTLEVPKEKLKVVFFKEKKDYQSFAVSLSPFLKSASGFWDPESNISFFFCHSTDEDIDRLNKLTADMKGNEKKATRNRDPEFNRLSRLLNMLVQLLQEELDIKVISHEATHQMAGSTGLLPRSVRVPFWVHEGLAMHFESPKGGRWAGIGAINSERLEWYNALKENQRLANLNFIIGDELFSYARASGNHGTLLDAYGQGWALTHFLLNQHFDETVRYYKLLGSMPRELILTPNTLKLLFDRCFSKTPRKQLENEFKTYMNQQKTDYEKATAGAKVET